MLAQSPAPAQQPASIGATVWLRPPYSSGTYASLASQLTMGNTSTIGSPVHIQGVQGLSKLGIRGNGKCEIGELPGPDNEGEGLLQRHVLLIWIPSNIRIEVADLDACHQIAWMSTLLSRPPGGLCLRSLAYVIPFKPLSSRCL